MISTQQIPMTYSDIVSILQRVEGTNPLERILSLKQALASRFYLSQRLNTGHEASALIANNWWANPRTMYTTVSDAYQIDILMMYPTIIRNLLHKGVISFTYKGLDDFFMAVMANLDEMRVSHPILRWNAKVFLNSVYGLCNSKKSTLKMLSGENLPLQEYKRSVIMPLVDQSIAYDTDSIYAERGKVETICAHLAAAGFTFEVQGYNTVTVQGTKKILTS